MKRLVSLMAAGLLAAAGLSACYTDADDGYHGRCDSTAHTNDCRIGPGDGYDEPGPMR